MTKGAARESVATRAVYCEDAIGWLRARGTLPGCSLITSLPDVTELAGFTMERWQDWFLDSASLVLAGCPDDGVAIFYQSDVKIDGTWIDKGYLCQKAAERTGHALLWHKVVCRTPPGSVTFGRPSYSHMLCFSRSLRADLAHSTADVLPARGDITWPRGMGLHACRLACRYVLEQTSTRTVVDPFCGHGLLLAVANQMGLNAIGIEIGPKRAQRAQRQQVPP